MRQKTGLLFFALFFALSLFVLSACSSNTGSTFPKAGDGDDDLDSLETTELDAASDNAEESDFDLADVEHDSGEIADKTDNETDSETTSDGDLDDEAHETETETVSESETDIEFDIELEAEAEIFYPCDESSSPFEYYEKIAEPAFLAEPYIYEGTITNRCYGHGFYFAGAKGMRVTFKVEPQTIVEPLISRMVVADSAAITGSRVPVTYYDQSDDFPLGGHEYEFGLPYSGEYFVGVYSKEFKSEGKYKITVTCIENCTNNYTRFPLVLMHGMGGFDSTLFNLVNYFQGVEDDLKETGYNVHVTEVAMFNDSYYRANEVESQLMDILTSTGARKINIIAHSQGGLDARIFTSQMGHSDQVAVIAMTATPNGGSVVADILLGKVPGIAQDVIAALMDFFTGLLDSSEADLKAALSFITTEYMNDVFDPANPDIKGVEYWSWAGVTCNLLDRTCRNEYGDDRVGAALLLTYNLIKNGDREDGYGPNDGMVQLDSATYGEFMGIINADHADEIGQLKSGNFDHKQHYRNVVAMIYQRGF